MEKPGSNWTLCMDLSEVSRYSLRKFSTDIGKFISVTAIRADSLETVPTTLPCICGV